MFYPVIGSFMKNMSYPVLIARWGMNVLSLQIQECVMLGKAIGSVDENVMKRAQIYHTIKTHLDKKLRLADKGIKVLSLFFIDEVKKYRTEDGGKGIYAEMFESCYQELISKPNMRY